VHIWHTTVKVGYDEEWAPFYDEQLSTNADIKYTVRRDADLCCRMPSSAVAS